MPTKKSKVKGQKSPINGRKKKVRRSKVESQTDKWETAQDKLIPFDADGKEEAYRKIQSKYGTFRGSKGGNWWKPETGENTIRLIPFSTDLKISPDVGDEHVFVLVATHWFAADRQIFTCPGEGCPICDFIEDEQVQDASFKARRQYKANAIVRDKGRGRQVIASLAPTIVEGFSGGGRARRASVPGIKDYLTGNLKKEITKIKNALHPRLGRDFLLTRIDRHITVYEVEPVDKSSPWGIKVEPVDLLSTAIDAITPMDQLESVARGLPGYVKKSRGRV